MRQYILLLYLFTLFISHSFATNRQIDSLQNLINQLDTNDKTTLKLQIELRESLIQAKISNGLIENMDSDLASLGRCHLAMKDNLSYLNTVFLTKALWQSKFTQEMGNALINYQKYFAEMQKINKTDSINPYVYIDLGNLYLRLEIKESAWRYYELAEQVFKQKNNQEALATVYNNLVQVAIAQKRWDTVAVYTQKAIEMSQQIKDTVLLIAAYVTGATAYHIKRDYEQAIQLGLLALELVKTEGIEQQKSFKHYVRMPYSICLHLIKCYYELDSLDKCRIYLDMSNYFVNKYDLPAAISLAYWEVKILMKEQKWRAAADSAHFYLKQNYYTDTLRLRLLMYENLYEIYQQLNQKDKVNEFGYKLYKLKFENQTNLYDEKLLMTNNLVLQLQNEQTINLQQTTIATQQLNAQKDAQVRFYLWLALGLAALVLLVIVYSAFRLNQQHELIKKYSTELENSNRDKELLLSVIGHDVRSPFQSIFNNIDQVYTYFDVAKQSPVLQKLAQAKKSAEQVFVLLDNLLQWVVLQKQQINPQEEQVNLNGLLQELHQLFTNMNLLEHLRLDITEQLPIVSVDKALVTIIFRNLLLNAIKYSNINSVVKINYKIANNQCFIEIENEIKEVSEALIHRIQAYKEKQGQVFKGGGLGLRLVDEIANKIGLKIIISNHKENAILTQVIFPLSNCLNYNVDNNALVAVVPQVDKGDAYALKFRQQDKINWQNFVVQISACEVYEASRIKIILQQQQSLLLDSSLQKWQTELNRAVRDLDEEAYVNLIKILVKSFYEQVL